MKVLVVFVLLFGVALSRPARSYSNSDSDSSEEVVRRPTSSLRKGTLFPLIRSAIVQTFKASADSEETTEAKEEDNEQEAAAEDSDDSNTDSKAKDSDSQDSEDDDDDTEEEESEEEEEEEEEEDDSSNSSESGESTTDSPAVATVMVTDEPFAETTIAPIVPTIITDPDQGRGDNLGGYPSDYKSIDYAEEKSYNKHPSPYKSYEYVDEGKKSAYDMTHGNEVEKSMMVYKVQALQVHSDYLEEDTSTPEVDSQSLDNSIGAQEETDPRQALLPAEEEEEAAANGDSTSTPEEDDASASEDSDDDESQSNEDSDQSDESDSDESDEQGAGPDSSTDMPVVITAK